MSITDCWEKHGLEDYKLFNINEQIAVFGKIEFFNGRKINHPEFDILDDQDNLNTGQILFEDLGRFALIR